MSTVNASRDFQERMARARQRYDEAISSFNSRLDTLNGHLDSYVSLQSRLHHIASRTRHEIMVPFGTAAFFPGYLHHTNELTVLLGENIFAERSTVQALEIVDRRIAFITKQKKVLEDEKQKLLDSLEGSKEFFGTKTPRVVSKPEEREQQLQADAVLRNEEGEEIVEITEEYHSEEEEEEEVEIEEKQPVKTITPSSSASTQPTSSPASSTPASKASSTATSSASSAQSSSTTHSSTSNTSKTDSASTFKFSKSSFDPNSPDFSIPNYDDPDSEKFWEELAEMERLEELKAASQPVDEKQQADPVATQEYSDEQTVDIVEHEFEEQDEKKVMTSTTEETSVEEQPILPEVRTPADIFRFIKATQASHSPRSAAETTKPSTPSNSGSKSSSSSQVASASKAKRRVIIDEGQNTERVFARDSVVGPSSSPSPIPPSSSSASSSSKKSSSSEDDPLAAFPNLKKDLEESGLYPGTSASTKPKVSQFKASRMFQNPPSSSSARSSTESFVETSRSLDEAWQAYKDDLDRKKPGSGALEDFGLPEEYKSAAPTKPIKTTPTSKIDQQGTNEAWTGLVKERAAPTLPTQTPAAEEAPKRVSRFKQSRMN